MARQRGGSSQLEAPPAADGPAQEQPPAPAVRALPTMPTVKTTAAGRLEDKTVLVYGPPGIGKSTLASEFAGGSMFFFDCAGELSDLEVFRGPVLDWRSFREWAAAYVKAQGGKEPQYGGCVIDTADRWSQMCSAQIRQRHGILHESDLDWGKGWDLLKTELTGALSKLMVTPGGVVLISHSKEVEIKRRRQEPYNRSVPTLSGGTREAIVNAADLVLFVDWAEDGENRAIYTKPDQMFEAKERGQMPRLPKEIEWPVGRSGWDVLKEAWDNGALGQ